MHFKVRHVIFILCSNESYWKILTVSSFSYTISFNFNVWYNVCKYLILGWKDILILKYVNGFSRSDLSSYFCQQDLLILCTFSYIMKVHQFIPSIILIIFSYSIIYSYITFVSILMIDPLTNISRAIGMKEHKTKISHQM